MALHGSIESFFSVLGLTYNIATLERMAITHAYSLQHYGSSYMDPYSEAGEYPGDLSVKLLTRAYMMLARHARTHFTSVLYYYFPDNPFFSDDSSLLLPLEHIRVPSAVGWAPAREVKVTYAAKLTLPPEGDWTHFTSGVDQEITATCQPRISPGSTLLQIDTYPYQLAPPTLAQRSQLFGDFWEVARFSYPVWRVLPPTFEGLHCGTQATTVTADSRTGLHCVMPITDFMYRCLPSPIQQKRTGVYLNLEDGLGAKEFLPFPSYLPRHMPLFDVDHSNNMASSFVNFSGLRPFPGDLRMVEGGVLTLGAPKTPLQFPAVIAIVGSGEFRPAITLDRCEPYQTGLNVQEHLQGHVSPANAPSLNRNSPLMLFPVPSYAHFGFLEKFHAGVGQAAYVTHLSPDDSRYAGEVRVLEDFLAAIAMQGSAEIATAPLSM